MKAWIWLEHKLLFSLSFETGILKKEPWIGQNYLSNSQSSCCFTVLHGSIRKDILGDPRSSPSYRQEFRESVSLLASFSTVIIGSSKNESAIASLEVCHKMGF